MDTLRPPRFSLSLLGTFALTGPDGPVNLPSKKLAGLLAYLALTEPAPQPRDKLITLFWGSHFEVQARQNLRKALFRLRHTLGPDALVSVGETISLAPGLVTCDAARLRGSDSRRKPCVPRRGRRALQGLPAIRREHHRRGLEPMVGG